MKTFVTEVYRKIDGVQVPVGTRLTVLPKAKEVINLLDKTISRDYYDTHYGKAPVEAESEPTEEVNNNGLE